MKLKINRKVQKQIKFGMGIPETIEEAKLFEKQHKNEMWENDIKKEFLKVKVAFDLIEQNKCLLPESKIINFHIIFDVKHDLSRKLD